MRRRNHLELSFSPHPGPLPKGEGDNRAKDIIISSHRGRGGKQSEGANRPLSLRVKGKAE